MQSPLSLLWEHRAGFAVAWGSPVVLLSSFSAPFHSLDIYQRETQVYPASPGRWDLLNCCYAVR